MQFLKNRSFAFKLSLSTLCVLLLCDMFMLFFISGSFVQWIKKDEIDEFSANGSHLSHLTDEYCERVGVGLIDLKNQLLSLSKKELAELSAADFHKYTSATLKSFTESAGTITSVRIYVFGKGEYVSYLDKHGRIRNRFISLNEDLEDWVVFGIGMKTRKLFSWTYLRKENDDGNAKYVTTAVAPVTIKGDKNMFAVLAASSNPAKFDEQFSNVVAFDTGYYLFWEVDGLIVWHPNKNIELKKTIDDIIKEYDIPELREVVSKVKAGQGGFIEMRRSVEYDEPVYLSFTNGNGGDDWILMHIAKRSEILAPLKELQKQIIIIGVLMLTVSILLIFWVCHREVLPLTKLSNIVSRYGKGDFTAELPVVNSNDEIGTLINTFGIMRANLNTLIDYQKKEAAASQKRKSELEIAASIQQSALPDNLPISPCFSVNASMDAAKEIGGDFYDFFYIDVNHLAFLIADVSGKGVPAALFMMKSKILLKNILSSPGSLADKINAANKNLCANNKACLFVTAFVAVLDTETGIVEYVNAGHNPPLIKNGDTEYSYLRGEKFLVLGAFDDVCYQSKTIKLMPESSIFLYTDGVTEAQNEQKELYGEDRLRNLLNKNINAGEILTVIKEDIASFCQAAEQADDLTMLYLNYTGDKENRKS